MLYTVGHGTLALEELTGLLGGAGISKLVDVRSFVVDRTFVPSDVFTDCLPLNGLGAAEVEHRVGLRGRGEAFGYFNAATRLGSGFGATINGVLLSVIAAAQIPLLASGIFLAIPLVLLVAAGTVEFRSLVRSSG